MRTALGERMANIFALLISHFATKIEEKSETRRNSFAWRSLRLPQNYEDGSSRLRDPGSQLDAPEKTMTKHVRDMPITIEHHHKATMCMIGLANSFVTYHGKTHSADMLRELPDISIAQP